MRGRPGRVIVGVVGLALVGGLAIIATFLPWYEVGQDATSRTVSGWSMLTSHGFSFEARIEGTDAHGPTGAVTFLAGLVLLGVAYAGWWLAGPTPHTSPAKRQVVRAVAAGAGLLAGLALVLPLGVPVGELTDHSMVASTPRLLGFAGILAMSVLLAVTFVPRHYR